MPMQILHFVQPLTEGSILMLHNKIYTMVQKDANFVNMKHATIIAQSGDVTQGHELMYAPFRIQLQRRRHRRCLCSRPC